MNTLNHQYRHFLATVNKRNTGYFLIFPGSVLLILLLPFAAFAAFADDDLFEALKNGKVDFTMRYRYEHVDDDAAANDADASTLRTTLGYTTGRFYEVAARLLIQDVRSIGIDDFNDATGRTNVKTRFAVVADPSDTDVLEGYLGFSGLPETTARLGRQIITYRKAPFHRYMGTVLWRQNWQNHDAVSLQNKSFPNTTIDYAYSWNVNRIFTDNAVGARANFNSDSHFINIKYAGLPFAKIEAYAYLLDFQNAATLSVDTFGIRFSGGHKLTEKMNALYAAEFATQDDAAKNPGEISADYFLGEIGASFNIGTTLDSLTIKFNYELMEGDGGVDRFITPLATGHAYQGWADRFMTTPGDGIEDFYYTVTAKIFGATFIASYHDINSGNLDYDYGEELDLFLTKTFKQHYTFGLKFSDYDAEESAINIARNGATSTVTNDVQKFWVFAQIKF